MSESAAASISKKQGNTPNAFVLIYMDGGQVDTVEVLKTRVGMEVAKATAQWKHAEETWDYLRECKIEDLQSSYVAIDCEQENYAKCALTDVSELFNSGEHKLDVRTKVRNHQLQLAPSDFTMAHLKGFDFSNWADELTIWNGSSGRCYKTSKTDEILDHLKAIECAIEHRGVSLEALPKDVQPSVEAHCRRYSESDGQWIMNACIMK